MEVGWSGETRRRVTELLIRDPSISTTLRERKLHTSSTPMTSANLVLELNCGLSSGFELRSLDPSPP